MIWYSYLFKNFLQFVLIHTVKGFSVVNKAKVDIFLELSHFFDDPADIGNLISATRVKSMLAGTQGHAAKGDWVGGRLEPSPPSMGLRPGPQGPRSLAGSVQVLHAVPDPSWALSTKAAQSLEHKPRQQRPGPDPWCVRGEATAAPRRHPGPAPPEHCHRHSGGCQGLTERAERPLPGPLRP